MIKTAEMAKEMSKEDRAIVADLFSNLEVAHDHMATACSLLSRLSRMLDHHQLLTVIHASIRPLIQLKELTPLETVTTQKKPRQLPDEQEKRVKILLTPDPQAPLLRKEKKTVRQGSSPRPTRSRY